MTKKRKPIKRGSKKKAKKKGLPKSDFLNYETEYETIKPFIDLEDFDKSFGCINSLIIRTKNNKKDVFHNELIIEALKFLIYTKFNKISSSLATLKKLETFPEKIDSESLMAIDLSIAKADVLWKTGKQQEALSLLENLETKFSNKQLSNNIMERIGDLFNIKGIIYWMLGEVLESQNAFQTSLSIMGHVGNKIKFTIALNNIGNVYAYKGELNVALDHHLQALEIRSKIGTKNKIASSLGNIAEIYHYKGDYKKSLECYLQAKELFEEIGNVLFQAKLYYELIALHLEYDNIIHANEVLDQLNRLRKTTPDNEYIQMLYLFSEGLYFKKSSRLIDKFHGAINFTSIVNNKVIDNEITVQSILNLTDILLLEIRLSGNEEILSEIQTFCQKVLNIALSQNSAVLIIQGYLLESKLKLLDYKDQEAKALLHKAVAISKEKGISRFEYFASKELDKLLQMEEKWIELKERHAPLTERLDLTGIEETLGSLTRKREEEIEIEREEPILFIILQEGGLSAYSYKFMDTIKGTDDQLFGGFISAVNTFGQQIFSTDEQVERIKHGDYTLISKIVLEKFTFCYAFKGPSYLASKKFEKIIDQFVHSEIKKVFVHNLKTGYLLDEKEEKIMQDLVYKSFFLSDTEEYEMILNIT